MLETVAPKANYVKISRQNFQNYDFQVGGKSVSQSWLWNPGISGTCLGGLWGISGGLLEFSESSLGGVLEVSGRFLVGLLEVS